MTKASDNVFPKIVVSEEAAPATPASGTVVVYAKADGLLYSKDDAGTETLVSGGAGGGGGGALSYQQAYLSADVSIPTANTYVDGPSVTLSAGTWLITGYTICKRDVNAAAFTIKIWDGTTVIASSQVDTTAGFYNAVSAGAVVVIASGTPTWKLSVASSSTPATMYAAAPNNGAGNNASVITAIKIA